MAVLKVGCFNAWVYGGVALCAVAAICEPASALPVTVDFAVNVTQQYDYATGVYEPFVENGTVTLTFDNTLTTPQDDGQVSIGYYYGGTSFNSPFTSLVGPDPYGGGVASAFDYTFPNVSDYPSTFVEEFAAQGNTFSWSPTMGAFWSYHIEVRIDRRTDSRGGTGTADYIFTPADNIGFLEDALANPSQYQVLFDEYYRQYDESTGAYLGGFDWFAASAHVVSVNANFGVPEPSTLLVFVGGLFGNFMLRRRRSARLR